MRPSRVLCSLSSPNMSSDGAAGSLQLVANMERRGQLVSLDALPLQSRDLLQPNQRLYFDYCILPGLLNDGRREDVRLPPSSHLQPGSSVYPPSSPQFFDPVPRPSHNCRSGSSSIQRVTNGGTMSESTGSSDFPNPPRVNRRSPRIAAKLLRQRNMN